MNGKLSQPEDGAAVAHGHFPPVEVMFRSRKIVYNQLNVERNWASAQVKEEAVLSGGTDLENYKCQLDRRSACVFRFFFAN